MPRYVDTEDFKHLINASSLYGTEEWVKVMNLLADTPTADVRENVHAKWIRMSNGYGVFWVCSNCEKSIPRITYFDRESDLFPKTKSIDRTSYCPHCGARMFSTKEV